MLTCGKFNKNLYLWGAKKENRQTMIGNILLLIFYFTAPAGILFICRKNKVFGKIGPVLTLYILGVFRQTERMGKEGEAMTTSLEPLTQA